LDLKTFWDCIRASAGNSFVWETGCPMVFQGTYDPSFSIELQNKDNQLGYQIAKKYKVPNRLQITCFKYSPSFVTMMNHESYHVWRKVQKH
jgi:3-hydroxyisobutyrate dehydrogenase-like beta-hydroxyacid dehydrogenase